MVGPESERSHHRSGWRIARRLITISFAGLALAGVAVLGLLWALMPPRIPAPRQADLVISDVTIINPGLSRTEHQTIVVRQGSITEVRAARADDPAPICRNCFAIPGLIDAHVHTPPAVAIGNQQLFALLYLAYGVTSVRDLGQSDASIAAWARRLNSGGEAGPHVYRCGPVIDGRDPGWPSALSITSPDEGRAVVRRLAQTGVDCIKVYNHVDKATFDAIAAAAAQEELPLIGHVPHPVGLRGVASFDVQHFTGLPYLERNPPWSTDIDLGDLAAMSDREIDEALAIARARDLSFDPTIANISRRLVASDPDRFAPTEAVRHLPDAWRRVWPMLNPHPVGETAIQTQLAGARRAREIAGKARALGIDVLAGTDTLMPYVIPGESLHLEIDELARAFGDNEAALAAATLVNGRHIDEGRIGLIAPRARADILLTAQDPTRDLGALRRWQVLIAHGRRYDRAMLDAHLRRYDRHFHSELYRSVFNTVARLAAGGFRSNLVDE